jgi:hypothetical protein
MHSLQKALWSNKELSGLRVKTRRLFNAAKRTGHWDTYQEVFARYKQIGKTRMSLWSRYSQDTDDVPSSVRLVKVMAKQVTERVSTIKLPAGQ